MSEHTYAPSGVFYVYCSGELTDFVWATFTSQKAAKKECRSIPRSWVKEPMVCTKHKGCDTNYERMILDNYRP